MDRHSPNRIIKFLHWYCPPQLLETIEGDLIEQFEEDVKLFGEAKAKRKLLWNVIRFFRPGIVLRNRFFIHSKFNIMIRNYLTIATRIAWRNKSFTAINITGLVIGITSAVLLLLWIQNELSYDRFHPDSDRLYEAWNQDTYDGRLVSWDVTPKIMAPTLNEEYPQVEKAISFANREIDFLFTYKDARFTANHAGVTESSFWQLFNLPLLAGDANTALNDPFSIVLTEKFANKLFGDNKAIGEQIALRYDTMEFNFLVTGILKDLPNNTAFNFDYLLSWKLFEAIGEEENYWGSNSVKTFVKLKPGISLPEFNKIFKSITQQHTSGEIESEVFLYPVNQLHLYSNFENGVPVGGRIETVRQMEVLAVFLLLISCINFMNLATAKSMQRAKEVGIRKTIGAFKSSLILQHITESVVIAFVAGVISMLCAELCLPLFNMLTGNQLQIDYTDSGYWLGIFSLMMIVGLLAGSYPSFFLSSLKPVKILKSNIPVSSGANVRRTLVVFQFSFSIILIFATLVVREQIIFVQQREAGFLKDKLIYHPINAGIKKNYLAYRNDLLNSGIAVSLSKTYSPITEQWRNTWAIDWTGKDPQSKIIFDQYASDDNFAKTSGVQITMGRDFDLTRFPSDSTGVLVNESAAKVMGFTNPLGEVIQSNGKDWRIVGVFKDFITRSPFYRTSPMIIIGSKSEWMNFIHIRLGRQATTGETLAQIEKVFKKYSPDYPFEYHFVDAEYEKKFGGIDKIQNIASVFGGISILISCLGILGLSIHIAQKRVKEIGVRKVFGASAVQIIKLLSLEPIRLVVIAFLIGSPLAYWAMTKWLQNYEYKVNLSWEIFAMTGIGILAITLATISLQTFKSALTNPVNSLRSE